VRMEVPNANEKYQNNGPADLGILSKDFLMEALFLPAKLNHRSIIRCGASRKPTSEGECFLR